MTSSKREVELVDLICIKMQTGVENLGKILQNHTKGSNEVNKVCVLALQSEKKTK